MNIEQQHKADKTGFLAAFFIVVSVAALIYFQQASILAIALLTAILIPVFYLLFVNKSVLLQVTMLLVPLSLKITSESTGASVAAPSEFLISLIVLFTIPVLMFGNRIDRKILMHPITLLLFADTAWMIFTAVTSEMPDVSFKRVIMRIIFITGYYFIFAHLFKDKKILSRPHLLYAIGLVPAIFYIWYSHAEYNFDPRTAFDITRPFYPEHTSYAAAIAFVIPFVTIFLFNAKIFTANKTRRNWLIVLLVILYAAEFLAYSRAAIISLGIVVVLYGMIRLFKVKLWHLLSMMFVATVFIFSFSGQLLEWARTNDAVSNDGNISNHYKSVTNITRDASNLERLNRWICAYRMFEERPLTGFGPGTYQFQYAEFQTIDNTTTISTTKGDRGNAHSEYLSSLSEMGIIGLFSFVGLTLYTIYLGLTLYYARTDKQIRCIVLATILGLFTFFFHGFFNAFLDQDKMTALVFPALAILVAIDVYHKNQSDTTDQVAA